MGVPITTNRGTFSADIKFFDVCWDVELFPISSSVVNVLKELFAMGDIDISELDTIDSITINCLEDRTGT